MHRARAPLTTARRVRLAVLVFLAFVLGFAGTTGTRAQDKPPLQGRTAVVLTVQGAISPATAEYVIRNIDEAAEGGAGLVVLQLDTPGGLDASMRDIIRAIVNSPVPVASYVTPRSARAASAGTYILYASHIAAMAPSTNLGAATPVSIGGGGGSEDDRGRDWPFGGRAAEETSEDGDGSDAAEDEGEAPAQGSSGKSPAEAKAINDAAAYIRGLAELRGRNAEWAERAVREAVSLTASEAAAQNVIDFVASDLQDLMAQADGMTVDLAGETVTLDLKGLSVERIDPGLRTELLAIITNPNVALLLLMVGVYGLLFEGLNPGALVPGTIGGISLLLGLYALAVLPLNMAGAALIALGLGLVVAEAFAPSFGILGIGGTAALVFGATILVDGSGPGVEVSIPLIAAIAVTGLVLTMITAHLAMRSSKAKIVSGEEEMIGATAQVMDWQGKQGHVWLHSERWRAKAEQPLAKGDRVRVIRLSGLTLDVEPDRPETE